LPPDTRFLFLWAAVAIASFDVSWWLVGFLLQHGFYGNLIITDVPVYQGFGDLVVSGRLPYRDFAIEYPPLALPVFLIPSLLRPDIGNTEAYEATFSVLMLLAGSGATVLVLVTAWRLGWSRGRLALAAGFVAISPLLIGPVILSRYDLWPVVLLAAALAAVSASRYRLGALLLGLAIGAKLYPIVLVPLMAVYVLRQGGPREFRVSGGVLVATLAIVFVPFAVLAPEGFLNPVIFQLGRPLQVESLGAAILFVGHQLFGLSISVESSYGLQNVAGGLAQSIKLVEGILQIASVVLLWAWFARGPAESARLMTAAAAAVIALIAFDSTISPQYMIWFPALVALVPGRRGMWAMAGLTLALLLTVKYFPHHYYDLVNNLDPGVAWTILVRDLFLLVLVLVLVLPWADMAERARDLYNALDRRVPIARLLADPGRVLAAVLVVSFLLRALWLSAPTGSLIFDETYYVNAARVMLGIHPPAGAPYANAQLLIDPNGEHPPLGKALIAVSMFLFGDNGLGWRVPSVIAGMVALVSLYGIVRALGGRRWIGVMAVGLYSLDTLSFIHGRIGTLDMMSLGFLLGGAWLALRERWALAGAALAMGTLVKVPGLYGFIAVLAWIGLGLWRRYRHGDSIRWPEFRPVAVLVGAYVAVGLVGLWLLDLRFTTYATPFDHIAHVLSYGFALQPTYSPNSITSAPWQWLVNVGQFDYLRIDVNTIVNGKVTGATTGIEFRALLNPVLIGSAALAGLFGAWLAWRRGEPLATWALIWVGANYIPFWFLALFANRITYFYYALPAVPGLALLCAVLLVHARLPKAVQWGYVLATAIVFIGYFPFRQIP